MSILLSNGDLLEHGDFIKLEAYTSNTDSWKTLYGVASITPKTPEFDYFIVHLCHDDQNYVGEMFKGDKFGYKNGWVFYIKMNGEPIDSNLIRNIKKLESGSVLIGEHLFKHGDKVVTFVYYNDEHFDINDCKLSIRFDEEKGLSSRHLCLSQNEADGDNCARENFGYSLGWFFTVEEGKITSCDTYDIKHLDEVKAIEKVQKATVVNEYYNDDDPMPMDWVMEEKIPDDL